MSDVVHPHEKLLGGIPLWGDVKWFIGVWFLLGDVLYNPFTGTKGMCAFLACKGATWLTCHGSESLASDVLGGVQETVRKIGAVPVFKSDRISR